MEKIAGKWHAIVAPVNPLHESKVFDLYLAVQLDYFPGVTLRCQKNIETIVYPNGEWCSENGSVRVIKSTGYITYTEGDTAGGMRVMSTDSVRVPEGFELTLYNYVNFAGKSETFIGKTN